MVIKQNLIFDLDGVILDTDPVMISYVNQKYGIKSVESDYDDFHEMHQIVRKHLGDYRLSRDDFYDDYRMNFLLSEEWQNQIEPMPGMCEVMTLAANEYYLYIATKRSDRTSRTVKMLLDRYIPGLIENVFYAIKFVEGHGHLYQKKKDFISGLDGCNVGFFDDSKLEVREAKDVVPTFLFDPKFKHAEIEGVKSVRGWHDIAEIFSLT